MTSIERPSRRVRESATAMRYWGLRILPSRVSLILTAMTKRSPVVATLQFGDLGRICPDPVLPYVCDRRSAVVERQTASHCARTGATGDNPARPAARQPLHVSAPVSRFGYG